MKIVSKKLKTYGVLIIATVLLIAMAFAGAASADDPHYVTTFDELESNLTAGNYTILENNIQMEYEITIQNYELPHIEPTLDLKGHTLTAAENQRLFTIGPNAKFTLNDTSDDKTGKLVGNGTENDGGGGGILIKKETSEFVMNGGTITNCKSAEYGGGVSFTEDTVNAKFTMNDGVIRNCSAGDMGGGIFVACGKFTMNGGIISNCSAKRGGGIENALDGKISLTGGKIVNCSATEYGGGIFSGTGTTIYINNTALVDANNDVNLSSGVKITLGSGGLLSPFYGIKNISVADPVKDRVVVENGTSNASCFALSPALSSTYVLKAGTGEHADDLVLGEPVPYGINITTSDGTYVMTEALSTIHGDGKTAANGTATVVKNSDSNFTLTLTNFNASNMTGNVPIINASVPNLTIKLVGDSNLTGNYTSPDECTSGLLNATGNLTITGSGKLLVNNTFGGEDWVGGNSILAGKDIKIVDGAKVTAIVNMNFDWSDKLGVAIFSLDGNVSIVGTDTVVVAIANIINKGSAASIFTRGEGKDIKIGDGAKVTAEAHTYDCFIACALCSYFSDDIEEYGGNISITNGSSVNLNATSARFHAYAINAHKNILIDSSSRVIANATSGSATGSGTDSSISLYAVYGNITISDDSEVTAYAKSTAEASPTALCTGNNLEISSSKVTATAKIESEIEKNSIVPPSAEALYPKFDSWPFLLFLNYFKLASK